MEFDPNIEGYHTSDKSSFAYASAHERWSIIVAGAISDVSRTVAALDDVQATAEGEKIIKGLHSLQSEIAADLKLSPLPDDGTTDIAQYNQELAQRDPSWLHVSWLYGECYLYKRIQCLFLRYGKWNDYDIFAHQKISTFKSSKSAIIELATRYRTIVSDSMAKDMTSEMAIFTEMCEICLWGNATDLSLLTSLTYEEIQKLQGAEARKTQKKNILINDIPAAFDALKQTQCENAGGARVDIVLDNAGFELYVDLILAGYLLSTGLAKKVVLHPKSFPWFVSDVLPTDLTDLISALSEPGMFFAMEESNENSDSKPSMSRREKDDLLFLSGQWKGFIRSGKLSMREDPFWTTAGSYWRLPHMAPDLFKELRESDLVLFKGDLNYRKLTGDVKWETTTPFSEAIGPLGKGSGVRTLALRTCKADVVVGLAEGEDERLREAYDGNFTGARTWAWTGKWAVISFCDGKSG
ncbi:DUF89-domain-containing protein [Penicillium cf. griseofulvum]|nr:DUF89-domain-containing protein [Penicillium cf. griseofulvum]